jgi:two-component system, LytTR family, response regulator
MSTFLFSTNQFIQQVQKTPALASRIIFIEGDRNYSTVFFSDGRKILSTHTLGYYEAILEKNHFVRLHKSCLVNIACIHTFGHSEAQLTNGSIVPIARRRRKDLIERINNHEK